MCVLRVCARDGFLNCFMCTCVLNVLSVSCVGVL